MRKSFVIATVASVVGFGLVQIQDTARAPAPSSSQEQKSAPKTVVSGGDNMGTYIDAVQANFGKPNVTVTLPTPDNNKK